MTAQNTIDDFSLSTTSLQELPDYKLFIQQITENPDYLNSNLTELQHANIENKYEIFATENQFLVKSLQDKNTFVRQFHQSTHSRCLLHAFLLVLFLNQDKEIQVNSTPEDIHYVKNLLLLTSSQLLTIEIEIQDLTILLRKSISTVKIQFLANLDIKQYENVILNSPKYFDLGHIIQSKHLFSMNIKCLEGQNQLETLKKDILKKFPNVQIE